MRDRDDQTDAVAAIRPPPGGSGRILPDAIRDGVDDIGVDRLEEFVPTTTDVILSAS